MLPFHSKDKDRANVATRITDKLRGWWKLILSDPHSRSLLLFLTVNLGFAFVELFYGMLTNSLSLISDSFHMFFDCTGLLCGLAASLITKWKPNDKFSYGYVRAEVLAGFVNGLFLLFISFFIFSEAVERLFEPPEVHHDRLLVVSILGFGVNMLGIFVFHGHAHGHSHGGGGHSHGPSQQTTTKSTANGSAKFDHSSPFTADHGHSHGGDSHGHSHDHHGDHGHSHGGGDDHGHSHGAQAIVGSDTQIMKGVFLHILADTLGSVGVIISAVLMKMFGWMIVDPICSLIIATLIGLSVLPLIKDSASVIMMRSPNSLDDSLTGCYQKLMCIEGVYSVQEPHFWTLCSDVYIGMLKLEVSPKCDPKYVTSAAHSIFAQIGIRQMYIQLDFAPV